SGILVVRQFQRLVFLRHGITAKQNADQQQSRDYSQLASITPRLPKKLVLPLAMSDPRTQLVRPEYGSLIRNCRFAPVPRTSVMSMQWPPPLFQVTPIGTSTPRRSCESMRSSAARLPASPAAGGLFE